MADENARAVIECLPCPDDHEDDGFDIRITATGFESEDHLVAAMLHVVEKITGVRTDSYVHLVDACRAIAAREQEEVAK